MRTNEHDSLAKAPFAESAPEHQPAPVPRKRRRVRRIVTMSLVSSVCLGFLALLGTQFMTPAPKQTVWASTLIGHHAPDFTLATLSATAGSSSAVPAYLHLASLEGKPIILNFWASWCVPCQHEAPLLEANWQILQSQGILLLGIDSQDTHTDALHFLQTYGVSYPNVVDSTSATFIAYGLTGVPETFFLNRQGLVVSKVVGEVTEQTLQSNVRLLLQT